MRYLLFLVIIFAGCATNPEISEETATIIVSKIQPITTMPDSHRGFFVEIEKVVNGPVLGCCLIIYDTEYKSTFPKGWNNMYSGMVKFDIIKVSEKWVIIKQN